MPGVKFSLLCCAVAVSRNQERQFASITCPQVMAPKKNLGGAGNKTAQNYVAQLWDQGLSEADIRQQLKTDGYKLGRISQLLKATRPVEGQEAMARPAKRPAVAEGFADAEAGWFSWLVL